MAFNFNWSPLMADSLFYNRAQDLLTAALNKSPKPPIIIDDIVVTELNLGSIPPELEILEIGDLAEDRFRGIFKMSYKGDAYLTLKTVVQANPLNTYLLTRNEFTSMKPLAADAGLTIPLQLTLSEFHLSGFVILVFSKQKGLTVVFRNDPLESLKVSSTFDSIPFVRDYLQKAIEGQLRQLFMDELPAIIHRLSLRLWVPEYKTILDREELDQRQGDSPTSPSSSPHLSMLPQDPFLNPPSDPVDSAGHVLTTSEIGALSLDSSVEMHSLFSQKNLLRLAALADSQRTLSLFTPSISEVAFRACASVNLEMAEGTPAILIPRSGSTLGLHGSSNSGLPRNVSQTHLPVPSDTTSAASGSYGSRPGAGGWSGYGLSLGAGRHHFAHIKHANKKKKRRVVDLRKKTATSEADTDKEQEKAALKHDKEEMRNKIEDRELKMPMTAPESEHTTPVATTEDSAVLSKCSDAQERPQGGAEEQEDRSTTSTHSPLYSSQMTPKSDDYYYTNRSTHLQPPQAPLASQLNTPLLSSSTAGPIQYPAYNTDSNPPYSPCQTYYSNLYPTAGHVASNTNSGILEQALMMKMAGDLARRLQQSREERGVAERLRGRIIENDSVPPPPPYRQ